MVISGDGEKLCSLFATYVPSIRKKPAYQLAIVLFLNT